MERKLVVILSLTTVTHLHPKDTELLFLFCACSHLSTHLEAPACRLLAEDNNESRS